MYQNLNLIQASYITEMLLVLAIQHGKCKQIPKTNKLRKF